MKAMFVSTASSWGVRASGMSETAPTVPWIVSSKVRPVKTRVVMSFSGWVRVAHEGMSLDSGTFSGSQKLPVRRSQTSKSLSSSRRFQLMAWTRSMSLIFCGVMFLLTAGRKPAAVSPLPACQARAELPGKPARTIRGPRPSCHAPASRSIATHSLMARLAITARLDRFHGARRQSDSRRLPATRR